MYLLDQTNQTNPSINQTSFDWKETVARRSIKSSNQSINQLVFTPDGRSLISLSSDARVHIWDATSGINKQFHINLNNPSVDPSINPTITQTINQSNKNYTKVQRFDVTSDGRFAMIPNGKNLWLIRIDDGMLIDCLVGHFDSIKACTINQSNNHTMFSAGLDHSILVWTNEHEVGDAANVAREGDEMDPLVDRDEWSDDQDD